MNQAINITLNFPPEKLEKVLDLIKSFKEPEGKVKVGDWVRRTHNGVFVCLGKIVKFDHDGEALGFNGEGDLFLGFPLGQRNIHSRDCHKITDPAFIDMLEKEAQK